MKCEECGRELAHDDYDELVLIRDEHGRAYHHAGPPAVPVCRAGCISALIAAIGLAKIPRILRECPTGAVIGYQYFASTHHIPEEDARKHLPRTYARLVKLMSDLDIA